MYLLLLDKENEALANFRLNDNIILGDILAPMMRILGRIELLCDDVVYTVAKKLCSATSDLVQNKTTDDSSPQYKAEFIQLIKKELRD